MAWQLSSVFFFHIAVCLAMAGIAVAAYRNRNIAGALPLAVLSALVAVWTGVNAGFLARTDYPGQVLFSNFTYFPIALLPVALVYFAESYTGHETPLTRYGPIPLLVVPAVTQVLVWTNSVHHLFYASRTLDRSAAVVSFSAEFGPFFWVHTAYSYLLLTVASYYLLRTMLVSETVYSDQTAAIVVGVFTPWVSNALYLGGIVQVPVDPTPIAFSVSVVAFVVAIYRHRLLQMVPVAREVARDELMDGLVEGVLVLDEQGHVVDCNERAAAIFDHDAETTLVGQQLSAISSDLATRVADLNADAATEPVGTEVALRQDGTLRHFDVRIKHLRRGGGILTGELVSLRDVTERRQREQRLDVLNRTLRHDLRNEANVVLGYAELGQEKYPDAEWIEAIRDHVSGMVDLSEKVRQIEQALDGDGVETTRLDAVAVVDTVVADIEHDYPDLDIETHCPESAAVWGVALLDAAVRNAVENAVEHNDNPDPLMDVAVWITRDSDTVSISVVDNGPGIHEDERRVLLRGRETQLDHVSGLGLWIINWIVTKSGGEIEFRENEPRGSIVTIRLPAADRPDPDRTEADPGPSGDDASGERPADDVPGAPSNATPDGGSS